MCSRPVQHRCFHSELFPSQLSPKGEHQRMGQLLLCGLSRVHQGGDGRGRLTLRLTSRHMGLRKEENQGQEDVICSLSWRMGSKRSVLLFSVNY